MATLLVLLIYGSAVADGLNVSGPALRLAVALSLILGSWLAARWTVVQQFLIALPFFLLAAPVVDLLGTSPLEVPEARESSVVLPPPSPAHRSNVYWLVLDGYARGDVLRSLGGTFDIEEHLDARGFQVDPAALAPYEWTHMSLGATLSLDYLPAGLTYTELRAATRPMFNDNPVFKWFEDAGYHRLALPGAGWPGWQCGAPDSICLSRPRRVEDDLIYAVTVLGTVFQAIADSAEDRIDDVDPVQAVENALRFIAAGDPDMDYFVAIHVMSPHPPYRWLGHGCIPQDGRLANSRWLPVENYLDAARCTAMRTLLAVDRVLEHDPGALVVVQGDHGLRLSQSEWQSTGGIPSFHTVRLAPLLAMKLPERCGLGEGNNTVNVFRIVIGCLMGEEIGLLPSEAWTFLGNDTLRTPVTP